MGTSRFATQFASGFSRASEAIRRYGVRGGARHGSNADPFEAAIEGRAQRLLSELYDDISVRLESLLGELTAITEKEERTLGEIAGWLDIKLPRPDERAPDLDEARVVWRDVSQSASIALLEASARLAGMGETHPDDQRLTKEAWSLLDTDRFAKMTGLAEEQNLLALRSAAGEYTGWVRRNTPVVVPSPRGYIVLDAQEDGLCASVVENTPVMLVTPSDTTKDSQASSEFLVTPLVGRVALRKSAGECHVTPAVGRKLVQASSLKFATTKDATCREHSSGAVTVFDAEPFKWTAAWAKRSEHGTSWLLQRDT